MQRIVTVIGAVLLTSTAFGQQLKIPGLRLQFGQPKTTASVKSDVATLEWTGEAQALVDQVRARTCPVTSDQVPPANEMGFIPKSLPRETQSILSRVHSSSSYQQRLAVSQVIDEICAPAVIAKDLVVWHYQFRFSPQVEIQSNGLIASMPPGLMCYADNNAIGNFLRSFPLQLVGSDRPDQRYDLPDEWDQNHMEAPIIGQAAQSFGSSCHAWYQQQFFHPLIARQEARNNDIANIQKIYASTGLGSADWIVWEATNNARPHREYTDVEQFFNELNISVQALADKANITQEFTPPQKSEFEKTIDYNARVEQLRLQHDRDHDKLLLAATHDLILSRQQTFLEAIGQPEVVDSVYDADKEQLRVTITSKNSPLRVVGVIPVPLQDAQSVKSRVSASTVHILMGLKDGMFTVNTIVLWPDAEKIYAGTVIEYTKSPIVFNKAAAEQWPKTLAAKGEEQRQRNFLRQQAEAAKIHDEARSNPRLAFALQKAQSGDSRCNAIWSNAVAMARQPGMSESSWNQVVSRLADTADRVGCP